MGRNNGEEINKIIDLLQEIKQLRRASAQKTKKGEYLHETMSETGEHPLDCINMKSKKEICIY